MMRGSSARLSCWTGWRRSLINPTVMPRWRSRGRGGEAVLTRLVPLDLRISGFKINHTARSLLGHLPVSITRTGAQAFEVMVMRSMAASLVHDLQEAMAGLAARGSA